MEPEFFQLRVVFDRMIGGLAGPGKKYPEAQGNERKGYDDRRQYKYFEQHGSKLTKFLIGCNFAALFIESGTR